jgi:hypothetical protein
MDDPDPDAFDKTDEPELLTPVRPRGHSDNVEMLEADLETLPPLPRWARAVLVRGGFNPRHPPSEVDANGRPRWKDSGRKYDDPPPDLEVSSVEASFSLIRQTLRSGWSKDESEAILHRRPAVGGAWLRWTSDDGAFDRMWAMAVEMEAGPPIRHKKKFVSHPGDWWKVHDAIRDHPGISHRGIRELELLAGGTYPYGVAPHPFAPRQRPSGIVTSDYASSPRSWWCRQGVDRF